MQPLNIVMHLVLGADNTAYEIGPTTFKEVVAAVREGQFRDVYRVLALKFEDGVGSAADVTQAVAKKIFYDRYNHPIPHGGEAYALVERELSCRQAENCAWENARERRRAQKLDMMREDA